MAREKDRMSTYRSAERASEAGPYRRRVRRGLAGLAGAALLAPLVPAASADRTVIRDRAGDNRCGPADDIRRATAGHASRGRLKHVVVVRKANPSLAPDIFVKVGKSKRPRYRVWGGFGAPRVTDNRTGEETGKVKVKRRGNRWTLLFHPRALRNPAQYRWAANTSGGSANHFTCDQAPNKRYRLHRLGEP